MGGLNRMKIGGFNQGKTTKQPPTIEIEIMFTLKGVVAVPSVQVPLFHSLVNM